jgi:acyl carrier protein
MDSKKVFEKVKSLIAEKLEIDDAKITMEPPSEGSWSR